MTERIPLDRRITAKEIAVIRAALDRASEAAEYRALASQLQDLRAIEQCGCGCDSVDFVAYDPTDPPRPLANAIGMTPRGGRVGVIVWGTAQRVTGLEVYDLGADDDLKLPVPESIEAW